MLRLLLSAGAVLIALPLSAQVPADPQTDETLPAAAQGEQTNVGEPISPDSPDMRRRAQSIASPARIMAERLSMGGPLNIETNWGRFDTDGDDSLSPLEFGLWVMEASGKDMGAAVEKELRGRSPGNAAVGLLNETSAALVQVDANGDWRISREELALIAE
ncbi:hypothetical protein IC614_01305 [Allosphingosinicella flava]|uniref:EF-hand domain-containing protein n=1 Tax=Allosphingosinicella flava TaxID=2771430 RepID=A0A7T2LMH5_9SPHN|nr:hypothetical protein [Sphingosinicella flava]QPQ55283.1 hypothetical protein IC614_01305 [Sphingosinicella flava]